MRSIFEVLFDEHSIKNTDFHSWIGGVPDNWTVSGTASIIQDATTKFVGKESAKIVATGTAELYQELQNVWILYGKTLRLSCWVKCNMPNTARIAIKDTDGNSYSAYHSGSGSWEQLSVERAITSPTSISINLIVENDGEANFDAVKVPRWRFDEIYFFDTTYGDIDIQTEIDIIPNQAYYFAREQRDIEFTLEITEEVDYIKFIDLLPLVPEKFKSSETLLEDFVYQMGRYIGSWMSNIDTLPRLQDPYAVGEEYIGFLASLIGLKLVKNDNHTLPDLRNQLAQAIDWYKIKGTYKSLKVALSLQGFTINIYDMYTLDYQNFWREPAPIE